MGFFVMTGVVVVLGIFLAVIEARGTVQKWRVAAIIIGVLGVLLFLVAGVSSAIDYKAREAAGLPINPVPLWILVVGRSGQVLVAASAVIAAVIAVFKFIEWRRVGARRGAS